jgi:hypothetical protein
MKAPDDIHQLLRFSAELGSRLLASPKDRQHEILLHQATTMTGDLYTQRLSELEVTEIGQSRKEFRESMFKLADLYLAGSDETREFIRGFCSEHPAIRVQFFRLVDEQQWVVGYLGNTNLLLRLLAGFSLLDFGGRMVQDFNFAMSNLYGQARNAKLDFDTAIRRIAELSSDRVHPDDEYRLSSRELFQQFDPIDWSLVEGER